MTTEEICLHQIELFKRMGVGGGLSWGRLGGESREEGHFWLVYKMNDNILLIKKTKFEQ